jgi:hypothetical protein
MPLPFRVGYTLGQSRSLRAAVAHWPSEHRKASEHLPSNSTSSDVCRQHSYSRGETEREMRPGGSGKNKNPSIKAPTIHQLWAELILRGRKPYAVRTWRTNYRGPLAIHAAMNVDFENARKSRLNPEKLITGSFVGVAVLSDVRP